MDSIITENKYVKGHIITENFYVRRHILRKTNMQGDTSYGKPICQETYLMENRHVYITGSYVHQPHSYIRNKDGHHPHYIHTTIVHNSDMDTM